ncbi:hypothetical protein [Asaia krungthepensis]|nr:hypothetical protein [Asaia krungthepensis]
MIAILLSDRRDIPASYAGLAHDMEDQRPNFIGFAEIPSDIL